MHGFVTPETMDQWDKDAVQSRIHTDEQPCYAGRIFAFEQPGAGFIGGAVGLPRAVEGANWTSGLLWMRLSFHAVSQVRK